MAPDEVDETPREAAPSPHPGMSVETAFRAVLARAGAGWNAHREAALGGDTEGIHQARIVLRRLRAVLALFRPVLDRAPAERTDRALRDLGRIVGEARDWDVLVTETLPAAANSMNEEAIRVLTEAAAFPRNGAQGAAARALRASDLDLLLAVPAVEAATALHPIEEALPALLRRFGRLAEKRGKRIRHARLSRLHALRKRLKSLRYALECTETLHSPETVGAVLNRCRKLQQRLGAVNDAARTRELALRLHGDGAFAPAVRALIADAEARGVRARRRVPKAWRKLRRDLRRWKPAQPPV